MALLIFALPFHEEVRAVAVASKVVNASAKKIAKEVAVDTAVQMSMNMVIDYKYTPKDKTPKEGFSFVCMPGDRTSGGECSKPMEVKTNISDAEKQQLSTKIESNLERKVAGGIGASKFGKFLDWFVPIFSIGMGVAVIDYAIHGDVTDLFSELGYDALVEMGLITGTVVPEGIVGNRLVTSGSWNGNNYRLYISPETPTKDYIEMTFEGQKYTDGTGFFIEWNNWGTVYLHNGPNGSSSMLKAKTIERISPQPSDAEMLPIALGSVGATFRAITRSGESSPPSETAVPKFDELNMPRVYRNGEPIKIPAPGSLPFTKEDSGEELLPYPKPDGTTGFKTKVGTDVPPDSVSVGNPKIITNPNGSKTVVKAPSLATPVPSPSENGTIPKTPTDEVPKEEDISCERLKKPDFKPLTTAISTSFPFSIPWDLYNAFNNAFSGIGDERPEFEYKGSYNGKTFEWTIGIPKFFDSWMPFIRGLMILTFDIGLLYAIYRFTKGGGD